MDKVILEDFPANEAEFDERFSSKEACYKYLFDLRWPGGFRCPKCGDKRYWRSGRYLSICSECEYNQ